MVVTLLIVSVPIDKKDYSKVSENHRNFFLGIDKKNLNERLVYVVT